MSGSVTIKLWDRKLRSVASSRELRATEVKSISNADIWDGNKHVPGTMVDLSNGERIYTTDEDASHKLGVLTGKIRPSTDQGKPLGLQSRE